MAKDIEELLTEGEEILATAKKGWGSAVLGLISSFFSSFLFLWYVVPLFLRFMGVHGTLAEICVYVIYALIIVLPIYQIIIFINLCCAKFIVTNKRVFAKTNILAKSEFEVPVEKVVINVQKSRNLTYMTVAFAGGEKPKKFSGIKNVEELQAAVSQAARTIEAKKLAALSNAEEK